MPCMFTPWVRTVFKFQTGPLAGETIHREVKVVPRQGDMVSIPSTNDSATMKLSHYRVFDVQHDLFKDEVVLWLDAIGGDPPYR
jgi:hypothetical protein